MAYNTSRACVGRMSRYLEDMLHAQETITWPIAEPDKHARKIREAMSAARGYPEFERYHKLKQIYRLHPRSGWVEAEYIGVPKGIQVHVPTSITLNDVLDVQGVVGAAIKFAVKSNELHFPKAVLSDDQKLALYTWAQSEGPPWKLISHEEVGVTLTRRQVEDIFVWVPEEEEEGEEDGE